MRSLRKGFTLAEVLLTLAIVGIVAALTIPALLNNTNQGELKSAAKKAMSSLNQAIVMSIAQDSTDLSSAGNASQLTTIFKGKLNTIANTTSQITTADGMIYDFYSTGTCNNNTSTEVKPSAAACYVAVDVNGSKGNGDNSTLSSGTCTFKDKYWFILRHSVVVPANEGAAAFGNNCTEQALR